MWNGYEGRDDLYRLVKSRIDEGIVESKAAFVSPDSPDRREIARAIGRAGAVVPMVTTQARWALGVAGDDHAIAHWQSAGSIKEPADLPGAPYPGKNSRLGKPTFAVAMNSRLQRKAEDGVKKQGKYEQIQEPAKTVVLLERGMPNDKKTMPAQSGFDGTPKANAGAFAARHAQKGCLIFADGHAELHSASDLITTGGGIIVPQTAIVWTLNPDDDPN